MIQAQATARYVRTSAQKAGLVLDLIRGKDVNQALATLQFTRKIDRARTSPRCCARRSPTRSRRTASAATSIGCSSRRATPTRGRREARASGADGPRVPRVKRTAHLTVHVVRAAGEDRRRSAPTARRRSGAPRARRAREAGEDAGARQEARQRRKRRSNRGSESSPVRIPARVQQDLALALVLGQRLREAAARGSRAARRT